MLDVVEPWQSGGVWDRKWEGTHKRCMLEECKFQQKKLPGKHTLCHGVPIQFIALLRATVVPPAEPRNLVD